MRHLLSVPAMRPPGSPRTGVPGRLHREAAGERPPRARPQRRGSPGPIPNPAVKPAFAESTAARGCGRAGRRARGGRFSICAGRGPRGGMLPLRAFFASWAAGPRIRHLRRLRLSVWPSSRRRCGVRAEGPRRELLRGPFRVKGGQIDSMVPAAQRRRRARSGNLPLCGPFLRYEVERCLPDASLV